MHCKHCGFANGEDDHRCLRCGRRLSGVVIAAPPGYSGANALAPALLMNNDTVELPPALFPAPGPNVIPFDRRERRAAVSPAASPVIQIPPAPASLPQARVTVKRTSVANDAQGTLDFIPASPLKGRKLKTDVDAQVFCDQPVATPTHRMVASAIDGAMILFGFGLLVTIVEAMGGSFGSGKAFWAGLALAFALVAALYGLIWAIAGRETAGMHFTDLRLITFDGFQLDARSRALRFASSWLSFCSGGLGLLWAVADEESLTWHDHISKTFPTIREASGTFVKQRR